MQNEAEFMKIQESLKEKLNCTDSFKTESLKTVAGVDLAYWQDSEGNETAVCCIVIVDYQTHEILETKSYSGKIECPYVPGFLAFRELPLVLETVKLLEHKPDLYMFDGNGYLHPRHMGIASQASFDLGKPIIGVAKSYYKVEETDYTEPEKEKGSRADIVINNEVYGCALRTHNNVKPVFVSAGNYISLDTAVKIVLEMTDKESHIPVPTRMADLETHKMREKLKNMK